VNAINFDAHSDFRILEGAIVEMDFHMLMKLSLKNILFLLHENYTQKCFRPYQKTDDRVRYNTYDSIGIRKEKEFSQEMAGALEL
jgi:formiminoglutamase